MKKIVCVLVMMWSVGSWATEQKGDILLYKGETYELRTYCLELYFSQNPQINTKDFVVWSTNLWRGYIATFEIIEDTLYLTKIEGRDKNYQEKNLAKDIFPNEKKVKVDWYVGIIQARNSLSEKSYKYNQHLIFEIENSKTSNIKSLSNKEYKKFYKKQYNLLKQSVYYNIYINDIKKAYERFSQGGEFESSSYPEELENDKAKEILANDLFNYLPKFLTD